MKRSDFLAFIPALSAIPFVGKEIVKKADRIEIYQPEEVKNYVQPKEKGNTYVAIIKDDVIVGTAWISEVNVDAPLIETTCKDNGGASQFQRATPSVTFRAEMNGPFTTEMYEAMTEQFTKDRYLL